MSTCLFGRGQLFFVNIKSKGGTKAYVIPLHISGRRVWQMEFWYSSSLWDGIRWIFCISMFSGGSVSVVSWDNDYATKLKCGCKSWLLWFCRGFPFWLHDIPGISYRTDNEPFKVLLFLFLFSSGASIFCIRWRILLIQFHAWESDSVLGGSGKRCQMWHPYPEFWRDWSHLDIV